MVQIEFFTPEQQAAIPSYKEKWWEIALSTEPINQKRAATAIKAAYAAIGKRQSKLQFCSSPQNALSKIASSVKVTEQQSQKIPLREMSWQKWLLFVAKWTFTSGRILTHQKNQPLNQLSKQLLQPVDKFLKQKIASSIPEGSQPEEIVEAIYEVARAERGEAAEGKLLGFPDLSRWKTEKVLDWLLNNYLPNKASSQLYEQYWMQSDQQIKSVLSKQGMDWLLLSIPYFQSQSRADTASWLDFCFSSLNLSHNQKKWEALQAVIRECGWIFTHENTCFICDRPIKLSFDEENQLHSEEEAAIQFADGFSVHVHHGVASIET